MIIQAKELTSFWKKSKGLIGQSKTQNIYFKTRWGIHTFGVKFPTDIVILDNSNGVVKLRENLKPNRIFFWNPKYEKVLELRNGTIKKRKMRLGKPITLIFS